MRGESHATMQTLASRRLLTQFRYLDACSIHLHRALSGTFSGVRNFTEFFKSNLENHGSHGLSPRRWRVVDRAHLGSAIFPNRARVEMAAQSRKLTCVTHGKSHVSYVWHHSCP